MPAALLLSVLVVATATPRGVDLPALEAELQRIWRPAASVAVGTDPGEGRPHGRVVWLRFADELGPAAHAAALGWTPFTDGAPGAVVTVSPMRIRRALAGPAASPMPVSSPEHAAAFSRALARVAAHELGHVLLNAAGHERRGLMREAFTRDDLLAIRPRSLTLPGGAGARLRRPEAVSAAAAPHPSGTAR